MRLLQNMTTKTSLMLAQARTETMPNGKSVSKAILMSGKGCCGGSYIEKA